MLESLRELYAEDPVAGSMAGGMIGGVIVAGLVFALIFYVLMVIASWKIFEKAGEKPWKSLIPVYNVYILYKIVGMKNWFWYILGASLVFSIIYSANGVETTDYFYNSVDFSKLPTIVIVALIIDAVFTLFVQGLYSARTAKVFGKSTGFAVALFFFPNICWLILGFGSAKYNKKVALGTGSTKK